MKRPVAMIAGVVLALGVAGWLPHHLMTKEPRFQGKTIYEWLELSDRNAKEAKTAFQHMGQAILPYLKKDLCAYDAAWKKEVVALAKKQSLIRVQFTSDRVRRTRAVRACAALGPAARPVIPELAQALSYGTSGAILVLESFGPEGICALSEALTNAPGCSAPYGTARALGKMGANARIAVTNLVWEFENYSVGYPRVASAQALGAISEDIIDRENNSDAPEVVYAKVALLNGLTNHLWQIRRASVEALVSFKGHEVEVRTNLMVLLDDPKLDVRRSVTNALQTLAL